MTDEVRPASGFTRRTMLGGMLGAAAAGAALSPWQALSATAIAGFNPSGTIAFYAWDTDYLVDSNFYADGQPLFVSNPSYPGGGFYRVESAEIPETESYAVTYAVTVPEAGLYNLRWSSTAPNVAWASPFALSINGGPYGNVGAGGRFDEIDSTVQCYDQGNIQLYAADTVARQTKGTLPSVVELHNGLNTISFKLTARRSMDTKFVMYLNSIALTPVTNQVGAIVPTSPLGVFSPAETPGFAVRLTTPASASTSVQVTVTDYWHNVIHSASHAIAAGTQQAVVSLPGLATGNYQIEAVSSAAPNAAVRGHIAVVGATPTIPSGGTPFGTDAAIGELTTAASVPAFVRAIKLAGVSYARERYNWAATNPSPGVFDYAHSQPVIDEYSSAGVRVLQVYGFASEWALTGSDLLPRDLRDVYAFAKNTATHSGGKVAVWEVWNEPDFGGNTSPSETADRYAAFAKAAALGYGDSSSNATVSSAGLAGRRSTYANQLVENDVLSYVDYYSFHGYTYAWSASGPENYPFPTALATSHDTLVRSAGSDNGLWMTEAGIPIPKSRPDGALDGASATAWSQRAAQARYVVTSAVESLAAGTDHHFWFVAPYFDEFGSLYGAFSVDGHPYPAYSAMAAMTRALGTASFVQQATGLPTGVTGYWFDTGSASVLVIWASTVRSVTVSTASGPVTITSIMGSSTSSTSAGSTTLTVGPDPHFVRTNRSHVAPSRPWATVPAQPRSRALPAGKRVVLQPIFDVAASDYAKIYGAYQLSTSAPNTMTLYVYNFGSTAVTASLSATATGWTVSFSASTVTIPAGGRVSVTVTVTAASPGAAPSEITLTSSVAGVTSVAALRVQRRMSSLPVAAVSGAGSVSSWDMSGVSGTATAGPDAGEVRFTYTFGRLGGTGYPVLAIPNTSIMSGSTGIVFRLWAAAAIPDTILRVLARQSNGATYWTPTGYRIKAGWNEIIVPFESFVFASFGGPDPAFTFAPATVTHLQIGINSELSSVPTFGIKQLGTYTL